MPDVLWQTQQTENSFEMMNWIKGPSVPVRLEKLGPEEEGEFMGLAKTQATELTEVYKGNHRQLQQR